MKAKLLIDKARFHLADRDKSRYSDEDLIMLLNDALTDVAKSTTIFVQDALVIIGDGVVNLDLSEIATRVVAAEYLDEPLPLISYDEMSARNPKWQFEKGDKPKALVYGKAQNSKLTIYPIVPTTVNPYINYVNGLFGVITDISYSDVQIALANEYGDISGIPDEAMLKIYFVKKPPELVTILDEVEFDDLCANIVINYIVGHALRANADTQNLELGNQFIQLYYQALDNYADKKFINYVEANRTTRYNGGFN